MKKVNKKTSIMLSAVMAISSVTAASNVAALDPEDVLNDTLDELQQTIVDYIMMKNYISGNITLSNGFKIKLDYNSDGTVNILDASRAKNKILELSQNPIQITTTNPATTSATESSNSVDVSLPVTLVPIITEPTTTYLSYANKLQIGDLVSYKGKAYYSSTGVGEPIEVSGTYKVIEILDKSPAEYTVRLEKAGWVKYSDVAGNVVQMVPGDPDELKIGDMVEYEGEVNTMADGTGKVTRVARGLYKVINILAGTSYSNIVQLEGAGWVSYKTLTGKEPPAVFTTTSAPVTTTPDITTTTKTISTTVTDDDLLKTGDTVQYSGKAYYSANGTGTVIEVSGIYTVEQILVDSTKPYTVLLKNAGWVSYEALTGKKQPVVTTTATVTTTPVTTTPIITTTAKTIKVGDKVSYSGLVRYTSSGNGKIKEVSGDFVIDEILKDSSVKYNVHLKDAGWVEYSALTASYQPEVTTTTVTTTTTTTTSVSVNTGTDIKEGDYVNYRGMAYYSASGEGEAVEVPYGIYKVLSVLESSVYPYTVRLDKAGWVAYKDITGVEKENELLKFDGKTYVLKNSASKKYLTAGGLVAKSNVYQSSKSEKKEQKFRFELFDNTASYRLYVSDDKVVDIVKNPSSEISAGCNVQIYDAVDPKAQLWKVIALDDNTYKIVSAENEKLCLTVYGASDGSNTGKNIVSAGNVYLTEYIGIECQKWSLEEVK
ncbi:MAG: RICIN domain-containing protein [Oscillospiraceae bacterium]|nr:RICIN domain-containing protein [Oscillospiraceae bacterium]